MLINLGGGSNYFALPKQPFPCSNLDAVGYSV
jgi:hypothetical protein